MSQVGAYDHTWFFGSAQVSSVSYHMLGCGCLADGIIKKVPHLTPGAGAMGVIAREIPGAQWAY